MIFKRELEATINQLLAKENKKPILLLGARQTGKTTLVKKVASGFENSLYLNLEKNQQLHEIFNASLDPKDIILNIELLLNVNIFPDTLLIFDEIQSNSRAITSLKYFCEESSNPIIATGSNLGITTFSMHTSFPVGKIRTLQLFPMTFSEFLLAMQEDKLSTNLQLIPKQFKVTDIIHKRYLKLFDTYLRLGGMPEVIADYVLNSNFSNTLEIQNEIIDNYKIDILKYSTGNLSSRIVKIYDAVDIMLASTSQKFKLTKIDSQTYKTLEDPLIWLYNSQIVIPVHQISACNMPLRANTKPNMFKLFFNDTGLLLAKSGYNYSHHLEHNDKIYNGVICENYIAQVLRSYEKTLFYYLKKTTEIDFIIQIQGQIIPIEVKSGHNTQAKSLKFFKAQNDTSLNIKISRNNFCTGDILNIPIYAFDSYLKLLYTK